MRDIDLGFAGRKSPKDPLHRHLAALRVGDALRLETSERGVRLLTLDGQEVGRFSSKFSPPAGLRCIAAKVRAIMVWRKRDSDPEFQDRCRCEQWEVVLPELVFAP